MRQFVCGCDNGKTGSIVVLDAADAHIIEVIPYSDCDAKKLYDTFNYYKPEYTVLEECFMSAGFAHVASTNFEILGRYQQVLEMLNLSYNRVRAVSWRAKLKIKAKGRPAQKAAAIKYAEELFSKEDYQKLHTTYRRRDKEQHKLITEVWPDDNKCESALIAYYALLTWREQCKMIKLY